MTVGGNASENDVETGTAAASYNQFIPFMEETSDKSKHGVSEHSNTGLLPPQIQRSSESTSSGADLKMATIESSFNNENVSSSRKSRISSSRRASTTEERQNPFADTNGYVAFAIKVCMMSSDATNPPIIKDLRAIALNDPDLVNEEYTI